MTEPNGRGKRSHSKSKAQEKREARAPARASSVFSGPKRPHTRYEIKAGYPEVRVAGLDEVGRGCLAGPVVAAAVVLPAEFDRRKFRWLSEVTDSKQVDAETRDRLAPEIRAFLCAHGGDYSVGLATVAEIDQLNIYYASHLAMARAAWALKVEIGHALVDGNVVPRELRVWPATALIKGDSRSLSIACASILAKVWRDDYMAEMELRYPGYGFAEHKGYPTPQHTDALSVHGICEIHRRSFAPVKALLPPTPEEVAAATAQAELPLGPASGPPPGLDVAAAARAASFAEFI